jgi:hypothetical protein
MRPRAGRDRLGAALAALIQGGVLSLGAACASLPDPPNYRVHASVYEGGAELPGDLVLLPLSVSVDEESAGGYFEPVGDRRREQERRMRTALVEWARDASAVTLSLPSWDGDDEWLREPLELIAAVSRPALAYPGSGPGWSRADREAWWHKLENFDHSIGPALESLASRTGADAGLFLSAWDDAQAEQPRGGVVLCVVDFRTGDLLWLGGSTGGDARELTAELLVLYPGVDEFQSFRAARGSEAP